MVVPSILTGEIQTSKTRKLERLLGTRIPATGAQRLLACKHIQVKRMGPREPPAMPSQAALSD